MFLYAHRYEKIRYLGKGLAGEVYLVKDHKTGELCALKILHASLEQADAKILDGFRNEFGILKNVNHPSIAQVIEAGLTEGDADSKTRRIYMATEFVSGQDLFESTETISIEEIEALFVQGLRALAYLHQQNIFHHDIKPQNLLVTKELSGSLLLKVIDFGLANFYERDLSKNSGKFFAVGTLAYMAPEILQGKPFRGVTDLYSYGCTFYKAFTRQALFTGSAEEIEEKHLSVAPRPLSQINPALPPYLDSIFLKLLEKDPLARYQSAQAVIEDLNLLSGKNYPIETRGTRTSYIPAKGSLVGRDDAFGKFIEIYNDRITEKKFSKKPYLIITGDEGVGKTRFLDECRFLAMQDFIRVLSWTEAEKLSNEKIDFPCLIIADETPINQADLDYLELFFGDKPVLTLVSAKTNALKVSEDNKITLQNFNKSQTQEFLIKATGIQTLPDKLLSTIHAQTNGNLLNLTEYVKALLAKGFFKDDWGDWSQKILDDLGSEMEKMGGSDFIKRRLKKKIESIKLNEEQIRTLAFLTIGEKIPAALLSACVRQQVSEKTLSSLIETGIIQIDWKNNPIFSNPLYYDALKEILATDDIENSADILGAFLEHEKASDQLVLYYRGLGSLSNNCSSLLKLAEEKQATANDEEAVDILKILLQKKNCLASMREEALERLGSMAIESGEPARAEKYLVQIPQGSHYLKALELMGVSFKRRNQPAKAMEFYNKGLALAVQKPDFLWMEVVLKNRIAQILLDTGNQNEAEKIFLETWSLWKDKLGEEEKRKAIRSDIDLLYYQKGHYDQAISYLEFFAKFTPASSEYYPLLLYKMGRTYLQLQKSDIGEKLLHQALELLKKRNLPHQLYAVYNELGNLHEKRGQLSEALVDYQHAYDLARKMGVGLYCYLVAYNLAAVFLVKNNLEEAKKYFDYVIRNLKSKENPEEVVVNTHVFMSTLGLASIERKKKNFGNTTLHLKEAYTLLGQKNYLQVHQQYYWQEKADLEKELGNKNELKECLEKLESLKVTPSFNQTSYEQWRKEFAA